MVAAEERQIRVGTTDKNGVRYEWALNTKQADAIAAWDAKGAPPCSVGQAMKVSWAYLKKKFPDARFVLGELEINERRYYGGNDERKSLWFYKLDFDAKAGGDDWFTVVTMDGKVLEPVEKKREKN